MPVKTINVSVVGVDPMKSAYISVADIAQHFGVTSKTINRAITMLVELAVPGFCEGEYYPRQKLSQDQLLWVKAERKYRSAFGFEGQGLRDALWRIATETESPVDALTEFLSLSVN